MDVYLVQNVEALQKYQAHKTSRENPNNKCENLFIEGLFKEVQLRRAKCLCKYASSAIHVSSHSKGGQLR